ncbi:MAG: hypothetical protein JNN05_05260 [Candidatus Omnitrophica bacterium]|nr:hypothetical protein [Candidatus Omnitrophota bacterium]
MQSAAELLLKKTGTDVWRRGQEYAEQGFVVIQSVTEKSVEAVVHGTSDYRVQLTFSGTGISKQCNCPYAAGSKAHHAACKHMVAVGNPCLDCFPCPFHFLSSLLKSLPQKSRFSNIDPGL